MRPVLAPVLLHALRLLLLLAACGWEPAITRFLWRHPRDLKHLYTSDNRRQFHLQINPNGRVDGTPDQTVYSAVVLKTVHQPPSTYYLNIVGVKSKLNLCMDSSGNLFGWRDLTNDCVFTHIVLENYYDVYESPKHKLLVSLGSDKEPYVPRHNPPTFSQFLPRNNEIDIKEFKDTRSP